MYTSTNSGEFEFMKFVTYTMLEDTLIGHRGNGWYRTGRRGSLVGFHY